MLALTLCGMNFGCAAAGRSRSAPVFTMEMREDTHELELTYEGRRLLVYQANAAPCKPYVKELYSLDGVNVLLDAPSDHLHHHGLMYGVVVNGVNYWEEKPDCGYQRPGRELVRTVARRKEGRQTAEFGQDVYWVPGKETRGYLAAAVLVERRRITVAVDETSREVAVEWTSDFTVNSPSDKVKLSGAGYHGLGLRLTEAFDHTARRRNAAGAAYTKEATWDVTPTRWESMTQDVGGSPLSVTMFSDPANAGVARSFSMLNAFAYLSGTQGLEADPIEVPAGGKFRLRYLVTVQRGEPDAAALNGRLARWLEDQRLSR